MAGMFTTEMMYLQRTGVEKGLCLVESWHSILKGRDFLRQNQAERGPWLQALARLDFSQDLSPPHDFGFLSTQFWIEDSVTFAVAMPCLIVTAAKD